MPFPRFACWLAPIAALVSNALFYAAVVCNAASSAASTALWRSIDALDGFVERCMDIHAEPLPLPPRCAECGRAVSCAPSRWRRFVCQVTRRGPWFWRAPVPA